MANPSICGIADAPDPTLLKLRLQTWLEKNYTCNNVFAFFYNLTLVTLICGYEKKNQIE